MTNDLITRLLRIEWNFNTGISQLEHIINTDFFYRLTGDDHIVVFD